MKEIFSLLSKLFEKAAEVAEPTDPADIAAYGSYTQASEFYYEFAETWEYMYALIRHDKRFYNVEFDYENLPIVVEGDISEPLQLAENIWLVKDGKAHLLPVLENINDSLKHEKVLYCYKPSTSSICIFLD